MSVTLFQSTPPHGGRRTNATDVSKFCTFQSTPPRGGRLSPLSLRSMGHSFNPRPRAGGDVALAIEHPGQVVSIHAPARGATAPPPTTRAARRGLFQSTPPRGGRPHGRDE